MPENTRSLEEQLRELRRRWGIDFGACQEAADALAAKDKLLVEAREALMTCLSAIGQDRYDLLDEAADKASTALANLKATLDTPSTTTKES